MLPEVARLWKSLSKALETPLQALETPYILIIIVDNI